MAIKICGIELQAPTPGNLAVAVAVTGLVTVALLLLGKFTGGLSQHTLLALLSGTLTGALLAACGVSIGNKGMRAGVIVALGAVLMMGLVDGLAWVFSSL